MRWLSAPSAGLMAHALLVSGTSTALASELAFVTNQSANWFDNPVNRIDAATLEIAGEVTVGDGPRVLGNFISVRPDP